MQGKLVHFELAAKDPKPVKEFYTKLFGWTLKDSSMPGMEYYLIDGADPGGALNPYADKGPVIYFDTDDIDASIRKVRELGGKAEDKQAIEGQGWFAACSDPFGNTWSLFKNDPSVKAQAPAEVTSANR